MMRIIVDAFGGDNAPLEIIRGSQLAVKELGTDILLVGSEERIMSCVRENGIRLERTEICNSTGEDILMTDDANAVLKKKADSSMATGFRLLNSGIKGIHHFLSNPFGILGNILAILTGAVNEIGFLKLAVVSNSLSEGLIHVPAAKGVTILHLRSANRAVGIHVPFGISRLRSHGLVDLVPNHIFGGMYLSRTFSYRFGFLVRNR